MNLNTDQVAPGAATQAHAAALRSRTLREFRAPMFHRTMAWGIDVAVIGTIATGLSKALGNNVQDLVFGPLYLYMVSAFVYSTAMEGSKLQATLGKRLMRLKVARVDGLRLGFLHSAWRSLLRALALFTCAISYGYMLVNRQRAAIHDLMSFTRVVRANMPSDSGLVGWQPKTIVGWLLPLAALVIATSTALFLSVIFLETTIARAATHAAYLELRPYQSVVEREYASTGRLPHSVATSPGTDDQLLLSGVTKGQYLPDKGMFVLDLPSQRALTGSLVVGYAAIPGEVGLRPRREWKCVGHGGLLPMFTPAECTVSFLARKAH